MQDVFILAASRTPIGALNGALASYSAPQLASRAIKTVLSQAQVNPEQIQEVVMGNVISAGIGQAPARQAAIYAGIPASAGATTVNKVCGSGLKAVMMASQSIRLGEEDYAVAGGMESMSRAPFLLDKARTGYRYGNATLVDSILKDGLTDPYTDVHMGDCGEMCAEKYSISREAQDDYAKRSYEKAIEAQKSGAFNAEICSVDGIAADEEPGRAKLDKIGKLKPAFKAGGTITAANASKINDGAAAVVLASAQGAAGKRALAKIAGWATFSQEPQWFTTAPAGAVQKLLKNLGWPLESVDYFEINEAFSVVTLAVSKITGIPLDKVNVRGGAVALGHPIGASGCRILVTLAQLLHHNGGKRGIAAICLGGGEAVAVAIEKV
ncbi:MAG: acetyl-CoA C-acyltransferase [Elusimicrobia bacterium]|nr:acetyl-CoA C-acyltransferase [Elusimicrobiota bacterium]